MPALSTSSLDLAAILLGDDDDDTRFTDDELIPVRMLNEFTYCPRLAYLEWVQGEFTENLDTKQGTFGHRNVDKPSARPIPAAFANTSEETPLADEIKGTGSAVIDNPIDHRSGAVPVPLMATNEDTSQHDKCGIKGTGTASTPLSNGLSNSAKSVPLIPNEPLVKTRALTLSAYREGLVAKLDLLELEGSIVTPVEYKKGAIPANPHQAWEPERVQLCAQGLILRENGYQCDSGELYYIESRHRVTVPFDDALILRTRELVKQLREMGRAEQIPLPLVDSPKCPRCSLVGICLPDETNLLLRDCSSDAAGPSTDTPNTGRSLRRERVASGIRQLLPARDDALPLYVKEQGAFVGKDGDRLVVRQREARLLSIPMIDVSQVSLFGNVQMSAQALREVVDRGISVCHFSYGGWFVAMTTGHVQKNIELRMAQFATAADPEKSLALAKGFITAKIKNCRTMLRRHASAKHNGTVPDSQDETSTTREFDHPASNHNSSVNSANGTTNGTAAVEPHGNNGIHSGSIECSGVENSRTARGGVETNGDETARNGSSRDLEQLAEWAQKAARATSAETLLGLEGMAAKVYFAGFAKLLKGGDTFDFHGRNRRPPRDPINAVLSFVYSLLAKELTIAVRSVGFDPLLGFFHKPRYGRPSLALDLAEEFRPLIGDSTVMMLINNGEITASSFLSRAGAVTLTESGRKSVIAAFERRMEQEITHPIFGYRISYRRVLEVQARLLSRVLLGELASYPGFCTR